jgi:hypothetical protein
MRSWKGRGEEMNDTWEEVVLTSTAQEIYDLGLSPNRR